MRKRLSETDKIDRLSSAIYHCKLALSELEGVETFAIAAGEDINTIALKEMITEIMVNLNQKIRQSMLE